MAAVVEWRLVTEAVLGRLGTRDPGTDPDETWQGAGVLAGVTIYDAFVPDTVPLLDDPSGRIAPYIVLRSNLGTGIGERALYPTSGDSVVTYTATCVAGWRADCEHLASNVASLLLDWIPTLDGHQFGFMEPPPGYSPPVLHATAVSPARFWVPLQYRLPATR